MKRYLGDAVYADFDGQRLTLTTEDGAFISNTIVLEPEVWAELVEFAEKAIHEGVTEEPAPYVPPFPCDCDLKDSNQAKDPAAPHNDQCSIYIPF